MSTDHPSTSFLPKALHEATIALDFASVTKRVVKFSDPNDRNQQTDDAAHDEGGPRKARNA
jgi:hypothetical protein